MIWRRDCVDLFLLTWKLRCPKYSSRATTACQFWLWSVLLYRIDQYLIFRAVPPSPLHHPDHIKTPNSTLSSRLKIPMVAYRQKQSTTDNHYHAHIHIIAPRSTPVGTGLDQSGAAAVSYLVLFSPPHSVRSSVHWKVRPRTSV